MEIEMAWVCLSKGKEHLNESESMVQYLQNEKTGYKLK